MFEWLPPPAWGPWQGWWCTGSAAQSSTCGQRSPAWPRRWNNPSGHLYQLSAASLPSAGMDYPSPVHARITLNQSCWRTENQCLNLLSVLPPARQALLCLCQSDKQPKIHQLKSRLVWGTVKQRATDWPLLTAPVEAKLGEAAGSAAGRNTPQDTARSCIQNVLVPIAAPPLTLVLGPHLFYWMESQTWFYPSRRHQRTNRCRCSRSKGMWGSREGLSA